MIVATLQKYRFVSLGVSVILFATSVPALAEIDTFTIDHVSGPCSDAPFRTGHFLWAERERIQIASGERITVTLYGHGADFAQDAIGSNIHEWISGRGTTANYPSAPIMFGGKVAKGYINVAVRAAPSDGVGNRRVSVKWLTGNERFSLRIVANCNGLTSAVYRGVNVGSGGGIVGGGGVSGTSTPNLLPALSTPVTLTRPLGNEVATTGGGMFAVNSFFCSGLAANQVATVAVPRLTWGVSGVNIGAANTPFEVLLIDADSNRTLDTLTLAQGFPANTPLVQRDNYPGRATSIRVILNPRFQLGTAEQTIVGCFIEPGSSQTLDPTALLIQVDPGNQINEGSNENDNELPF